MRRLLGSRVLGGILVLAAALCGCERPSTSEQATAPAAPPSVTVTAAALKSVTQAGTFVGRVQAVNTVNLVSRVEGFLQKRAFTEGQQVKTGDLLFVIEQDIYQAAVDQAQAQLASAQATERNAALQLQRSQELVKTNAVPQATVDQNLANQGTAAAAVRSAQAALEQANINLAFTEIKAPIDGRIGMANVTIGNFVNQTTGTLATIVSQDPIYVLFPAATQQVLDYRQRTATTPGASSNVVVRATFPNGTEYPHPGAVDFLDIQVNQATDTLTVRAIFPNPDNWLVAGQIVNVTVAAGEPTQTLMIPQSALQVDQSGSYVLVVGADNKVEQRRVKLG
ncbi:MAG: efflux RND transporter periplasmic adaptor subunit, partial [Hyphomicrobiales bacterium]|nr:efflux RND transporter periplasmic adaptor subunit [Hyphomicrobiales bacterium]